MRRILASIALALSSSPRLPAVPWPVKTTIWLDGVQVRTILPPAASPQDGTDPF